MLTSILKTDLRRIAKGVSALLDLALVQNDEPASASFGFPQRGREGKFFDHATDLNLWMQIEFEPADKVRRQEENEVEARSLVLFAIAKLVFDEGRLEAVAKRDIRSIDLG